LIDYERLKRLKRKGLTVVEVVVIASIVLALGIFLMMYSAGLFSATALDLTEQTDRNIQLLRGILLIEGVDYHVGEDGRDIAEIYVRNIAKYSIDLTVTRIELLVSNEVLHDAIPRGSYGFGNLTKLRIGERAKLSAPVCNECQKGEKLIYRVWYISSALYNVDNPLLSISDMLYVEVKIVKPIGAEAVLKCPIPSDNWIMIDYVDPVTGAIFGRISSLNPVVNIRPGLASIQAEDMPFTVTVTEIEGGRTGTGSRPIDVPTVRLERVQGDYGGLQTPYRITISSDWNIIQREWVLDGIPGKIHVSGIFLQWSRIDRIIEGIMLELGYGEVGNYKVKVTLKDCDGDTLYTSSINATVNEINVFEVRFIPVSGPTRFDQVYYVETKVEELS